MLLNVSSCKDIGTGLGNEDHMFGLRTASTILRNEFIA